MHLFPQFPIAPEEATPFIPDPTSAALIFASLVLIVAIVVSFEKRG